jgi:hypothetical protein
MADPLERLQALSAIQTADVSALLALVQQLATIVRREHPDTPDVTALFLQTRKELLHRYLEAVETRDPALAARMQELIDTSCTRFPLGYE